MPFDNSYARLPDKFFAPITPTPVAAPRLIKINTALARTLGIDPDKLASPEGAAILAGNTVPENATPIAQAYAGHQFGGLSPKLGDGRAILLGEVIGQDGIRRDIQLKGSGPTPFSRRGDGRAALGPVLREYLVSEAMAALGVPTTRSLAAVMTGEPVYRETPLPGAVLARVASSHIRIGTFQYFAIRQDVDAIRTLADYAIARHYPDVAAAENPYRAFFDAVLSRQADLIARWLGLGFIHGVMNTDNMTISGETIDYGPCAFMDSFNPAQVYSSIDQHGRYAWGNQPRIAQWNLARLIETLLPLLDPDETVAQAQAQTAIDNFAPTFNAAFTRVLSKKIGLTIAIEGDLALAQDLLDRMAANSADFTLTFRRLAEAIEADVPDGPRSLFDDPKAFDDWAATWRQRLAQEPMTAAQRRDLIRQANPAFIPRNHRIEQVIAAATVHGDFAPFEKLHAILAHPFDDQPESAAFMDPPQPDEIVHATFCGT
ncbi:MAG: YdiU family protein [Hyphomicrobiaceae bacterium]|nr:YdiU family protein [Hyphomicrobiaceae bacterium]